MHAKEIFLRRSLPVFINSFNQFTYLKDLVNFLEQNLFRNIYILDNRSTLPSLLSYYENIKKSSNSNIQLLYYSDNFGPNHFHLRNVYKSIWNYPHIFSDPDLIFDYMDNNFVTTLMDLAHEFRAPKVGAALEIPPEDLMVATKRAMPETQGRKVSVAEWEARFWKHELKSGVYDAAIDTTFHLFSPQYYTVKNYYTGVRVATPGFVARHRPWYLNDQPPFEEHAFYLKSKNSHGGWALAPDK